MSRPSRARILAVDPGLTGAVALLDPASPAAVVVEDMPVVDGEVEPASLVRIIRAAAPDLAVVERVGPMPRDGAVQAFRFGAAYAAARVAVALCEVPCHLVTPSTWKRALRLPGGPEGKEQARAMALRLFPASAGAFARKRDHNRAEAALLARYAATHLTQ